MTKPDSHDCDAALSQAVVGARSGDADALESALALLHPVISRFLARRFVHGADLHDFVADVAQNALIRIARSLPNCRATEAGQIRAWALEAARSAALDYLRSPSSGMALLRRATQLDAPAAEALLWSEWQRPDDDDPTSASAATVLCRFAVEAQSRLSTAQVQLIWSRLVDRASWAEIGEEYGTTPAGAKRRYQRAQNMVRKMVLRSVAAVPEPERTRLTRFLSNCGVA
jgi:RNA polymerase sigma factor (sigma-70 family)